MNKICFFIFGIIASSFVESKPCDHHNHRICELKCRHKGGVRHCGQNRIRHLIECLCRHH